MFEQILLEPIPNRNQTETKQMEIGQAQMIALDVVKVSHNSGLNKE